MSQTSLSPRALYDRALPEVVPSVDEALANLNNVIAQLDPNSRFATDDPTLYSQAAALKGLTLAQANIERRKMTTPFAEPRRWFDSSLGRLDAASPLTRRERVGTHIRQLQALGILMVKGGATPAPGDVAYARGNRTAAQRILHDQHKPGEAWDPYGTMLDLSAATLEAIVGNNKRALRFALSGIKRARLANTDGEAHGQPIGIPEKFVRNYARANARAGMVALAGFFGGMFSDFRNKNIKRLLDLSLSHEPSTFAL